jgi:hypothetical protein
MFIESVSLHSIHIVMGPAKVPLEELFIFLQLTSVLSTTFFDYTFKLSISSHVALVLITFNCESGNKTDFWL